MPKTAAVPLPLIRRLSLGLAAGIGSLAITTVEGAMRENFNPWHQAISALSLGPGGWVQMINLVAFGLVVLTTVGPWRRILAGGRGAAAYPLLTAVVGICFVGVGLIRQDPAPGYDPDQFRLTAPTPLGLMHLAIAGVAAVSSVVALCVIAARLARDPAWRRWGLYSAATAGIVIACVAAYGVGSVQPTGIAGSFERAAMIAPLIWLFAFLRRLRRGAPLMIAPPANASAVTVPTLEAR
jgi:hypothetical protein